MSAVPKSDRQDVLLTITTFRNTKAKTTTERSMTWAQIVEMLRNPGTWPTKESMPLLKLGRFGTERSDMGALRHDKNLIEISGIEAEHDAEKVTVEEAIALLERHHIRALVYTSPSHGVYNPPKSHGGPRWRVLAPLSGPASTSGHAALVARLNGALGGIVSGESFTLSQTYYYGRIEGQEYRCEATYNDPGEGYCVDELDELDNIAIGKTKPEKGSGGARPDGNAPLWREAAEMVARLGRKLRTGDGRRELCKSYIGSRSAKGLSAYEVRALVRAFAAEYFDPDDPIDEKNIDEIVADFARKDAGKQQSTAAPGPDDGIDGEALLALDMPETHYLCRPWIPEGVTILAGRPKVGKTTLLRQIAVCASDGAPLWGKPCAQTEVLFLSLEEGKKLMRKKLMLAGYSGAQLRRIRFHWQWRTGVGGVGDLHERLKANPNIRFVIVDSLTRFRDAPTRDKPQFHQDYEAVRMLADVAKDIPGLTIIVLHHTKKDQGDDPIADISGTFGLTAAADNYMVLRRESGEFVLHCGGRYWDEPQDAFRMRRAAGVWELEGAADAVRLSRMQRQYLDTLRAEGTVTTRGMARRFDVRDNTASEVLNELQEKGLVERTADGWRALHTHTETTESYE